MPNLFRRSAAAAVVALVVPCLAACSSGSPSATPPKVSPGAFSTASPTVTSTVTTTASPGSDVCALVPPSDVGAAFGAPVTRSESVVVLRSPTCNYLLGQSAIAVTGTVQVINLVIYDAQKYETAKHTGITGGDGAVDVPGVAGDAYYDPHTFAMVLHKGDTVYYVGAGFSAPVGTPLDAARIKANVIALAKTVAGKI